MNHPILKSLLQSPSERECEIIFPQEFSYLEIILRLTKVTHEGSMHMPPSIKITEILKTTPFVLHNSGETSPSINVRHKTTTKKPPVFPFAMTT